MPPKGVDKAKQKEKEKIAVDKTFGMKNKNKSKVVQKYIKSITANVAGAPKGGMEQKQREEKEAKQKDLAKAALLNSLFNQSTDKKGRAFDPVAKKAAKKAEEEALAAGKKLKEDVRKEIIEGIANSIRLTNPKGIRMSELGGHPIIHTLKEKHADTFKALSLLLFIKANDKVFWVDDAESSNPMLRCQEDVDAEVEPDERSIEEIIEEKRAALPPGGTPVTLDTFKAWKEKREADRLAQVQAESEKAKKKTGSTNLVGMSGKDLFTFDASLFVDDDGAASADEYDERSEVEDDEEEEGNKGVAPDDSEPEDAVEEAPAASSSGAAAPGGKDVAINESLFLEGEDLPDDLDDLDDDDDGKDASEQARRSVQILGGLALSVGLHTQVHAQGE
eukprot:CAMPEP_0115444922 /NCGR_PEP_ID=MMETSP0271-20121206/38648_1 /TAXON_ID=71861 /ORGANISM="Scrippsiella trochoidea, Strain CCMP3099" /LENGTH=390 /DNA_ID=CAMNT_0002870873 /DNA_START=118 /DNA_END=1288 /DNA_ORIENTATION=+